MIQQARLCQPHCQLHCQLHPQAPNSSSLMHQQSDHMILSEWPLWSLIKVHGLQAKAAFLQQELSYRHLNSSAWCMAGRLEWESDPRAWSCASACSWPLPCSCNALGPCLAVYPALRHKVLKLVLFVQCLLRRAYDLYPDKLACTQQRPDVTLLYCTRSCVQDKHHTTRPWCWGWMTWSVSVWSAQAAIYLHAYCWLCVMYVCVIY